MSHLLPLSALHAAAPGVLDVIFGADGDFEGAPLWRPPLWGTLRPRKGNQPDADDGQTGFVFRYTLNTAMRGNADLAVVMDGPAAIWGIGGAALDCRIPSVAARLIWLCGLALGYNGPLYCYESHDEDCNGVKHDDCCWYLLASRAHEGGAYYWQKNFSTEAAFIASMTLALAPKIAALGGSRV